MGNLDPGKRWELLAPYRDGLVAVASRRGVRADAEDVAHEAFTGADGVTHQLRLVESTGLSFDGVIAGTKAPAADGGPSAQPMSVWCNVKVGAAVAAITTVGAAAILIFIAGLPVTSSVALAGLTFTVSQWTQIAIAIGAGGGLVPLLQTLLCWERCVIMPG